MTRRVAVVLWVATVALGTQQPDARAAAAAGSPPSQAGSPHGASARPGFQTSHECIACHNGLTTSTGEDVSIGVAWRASMMANSSRDPYWQASVRRETIDHPAAAAEIENECAICHMPMSSTLARADGRHAEIFGPLAGQPDQEQHRLAADGVSCTLCHQISAARLGTPESFTGGFVLDASASAASGARMLGPFEIDRGRTTIMRSSTAVTPTKATHLEQSEVCATCHTLFTNALGPDGQAVGRLPEQVPYLEWRHSAFRTERTCQSCHMPVVEEPVRIASVLGEPREGLNRHTFLGGNFFMLRMLNRYRDELGVEALPSELDAAAQATLRQLETKTATVAVSRAQRAAHRLDVEVEVRNATGHKLPTGYPSRRAWLHLAVRDAAGRLVFESGAVGRDGGILGNDNDADGSRYERHYDTITASDQVQIYEAVMIDRNQAVTTGLLHATAFVKDNRLLPRGFDKAAASADIAVRGPALDDDDFTSEGDRVSYGVEVGDAQGPLAITVKLWYQPIAYRWAQNLRRYDAPEPRRFTRFYNAMAPSSATVLAEASVRTE
jgi:hypothetical protein